MQSRGDKNNPPSPAVGDEPVSFAPHDPAVQTAWGQLDRLNPVTACTSAAAKENMIGLARTIIELRRHRTHVFPPAIFGEPAWDMLLALFARPCSGEGETVSNLGMSSGTPATTALRWIDYLEREGFVIRRSSRTDKRVVFVELTDKANDAIREYLTRLVDKGILAIPERSSGPGTDS